MQDTRPRVQMVRNQDYASDTMEKEPRAVADRGSRKIVLRRVEVQVRLYINNKYNAKIVYLIFRLSLSVYKLTPNYNKLHDRRETLCT